MLPNCPRNLLRSAHMPRFSLNGMARLTGVNFIFWSDHGPARSQPPGTIAGEPRQDCPHWGSGGDHSEIPLTTGAIASVHNGEIDSGLLQLRPAPAGPILFHPLRSPPAFFVGHEFSAPTVLLERRRRRGTLELFQRGDNAFKSAYLATKEVNGLP